MIVVINPSGSAGRSFKGLHAYCAHDQDHAQTTERVEWIDMRNIAANDPAHAWKVMAATAGAQNELKRAAGIRAGRASKDGVVMHVVLSFDKDEPTDREAMQNAADEFLSHLGADPAKMRGKSKPKRRQFADEHQVVMYAHTDTDNAHLHLMINTVHPEHGVKLPTSNNQIKAQKWAEDFSKRHGTDHKTPAREENREMREAGEYVKGERRKSRNMYELEQQLEAVANDNDQLKAEIAAERKKDAALALRGRNLAQLQQRARDSLVDGHKVRKSAIARSTQKDINKAKAAIREEFRPQWRELRDFQASERKTFEELEASFFGRASNIAKTVRLTSEDIGEGRTNIISRTFRILTNASERRAYFDAAQERARKAVEREQVVKVSDAAESLKDAQAEKLAANRTYFEGKRAELLEVQKAEQAELQADWKLRSEQRAAKIEELRARMAPARQALSPTEHRMFDQYMRKEFDKTQRPAPEQNNRPSRDDDRER